MFLLHCNTKTCEPPLPTSAACRDWQPHVQLEATAALRRLAAADPLLLLRCDSLPQLVHLVTRQVFSVHGSRELQEAVDALLMGVRAAATAAGRAEQHLWPVWQHHAPTAGPASQLTKTFNLLASAAAAGGMPVLPTDPWDRLAARMAVLQAVGRRGSSFSGGGGSAGSHAWARAAAASAGVPGSTYPPGANVLLAQVEAGLRVRAGYSELRGRWHGCHPSVLEEGMQPANAGARPHAAASTFLFHAAAPAANAAMPPCCLPPTLCPAGMSPTAAAALRDATMRSAAAELMGYGMHHTDMYGDTEDEDYFYDEDYVSDECGCMQLCRAGGCFTEVWNCKLQGCGRVVRGRLRLMSSLCSRACCATMPACLQGVCND